MPRQHQRLFPVPNDEIERAIDLWIKGERDRAILKRRFIDELTHDELAKEFHMSVENVKRVLYTKGDFVLCKLP
jgi:DNA-directed RNA polymerase specialized sigma24 family protein